MRVGTPKHMPTRRSQSDGDPSAPLHLPKNDAVFQPDLLLEWLELLKFPKPYIDQVKDAIRILRDPDHPAHNVDPMLLNSMNTFTSGRSNQAKVGISKVFSTEHYDDLMRILTPAPPDAIPTAKLWLLFEEKDGGRWRVIVDTLIANSLYAEAEKVNFGNMEQLRQCIAGVAPGSYIVGHDYACFYYALHLSDAVKRKYVIDLNGRKFFLNVLAMGHKAAVSAAQRISRSVADITAKIAHGVHVVDVIIDNVLLAADDEECARHALDLFCSISRDLGLQVKESFLHAPGEEFEHRGCCWWLRQGGCEVKLKPKWISKLEVSWRESSPEQLSGKLAWIRAALNRSSPSIFFAHKECVRMLARQPQQGWSPCMARLMTKVINFCRSTKSIVPRQPAYPPSQISYLFTDASTSTSRGAYVLVLSDGRVRSNSFVLQQAHINVMEYRALVESLRQLRGLLRSTKSPLRICVDNVAVECTLRSAWSPSPVLYKEALRTRMELDALGLPWSVSYIATSINPADFPSRNGALQFDLTNLARIVAAVNKVSFFSPPLKITEEFVFSSASTPSPLAWA